MRRKFFLYIACGLLATLACGLFRPRIPPEALLPPPTSFRANPTLTAASKPTVLPVTSTPTDLPFTPFSVTNSVDNLMLRTGPGTLFDARAALQKDAQLLVLGQSPGGQWIYVKTTDEHTGWVFSSLLNPGTAITRAPIIQPGNTQVITGRVADASGNPISGIQFSFIQGSGSNPPRDDAVTDATGTFYAFMPLSAQGTWTVSYTAVACTSNTMDANCNCLSGICGKPDPELTAMTLPFSGILSFVWK